MAHQEVPLLVSNFGTGIDNPWLSASGFNIPPFLPFGRFPDLMIPNGPLWPLNIPTAPTTGPIDAHDQDNRSTGFQSEPSRLTDHSRFTPHQSLQSQANAHTSTATSSSTGSPASTNIISAQLEDGTFVCTIDACHAKFKRNQELRRHQQSRHQRLELFFCRVAGCKRKKGFPRKDKWRDHERKVHGTPEDALVE
ncbi:hypothetical protein QBC47DRAFT_402656 [Echria macrotheca]|uniref:C2H2-type domain-containing protein n=1 Tax=Echria macrotheca TaxID=438768 RepID=A0AAJ0BC53_9PEZI|nr:hypothetical protein QBC47DRAFT_402656 [Echria macrotheca]